MMDNISRFMVYSFAVLIGNYVQRMTVLKMCLSSNLTHDELNAFRLYFFRPVANSPYL